MAKEIKSILHEKDGTCFLCMRLLGYHGKHSVIHEHHIFGGTSNRKNSGKSGLKVYLCLNHHVIGPEAVHNNAENQKFLHEEGQRAYERTHTRQQFYDLIGKYYLHDEPEEVAEESNEAPDLSGITFLEENDIE